MFQQALFLANHQSELSLPFVQLALQSIPSAVFTILAWMAYLPLRDVASGSKTFRQALNTFRTKEVFTVFLVSMTAGLTVGVVIFSTKVAVLIYQPRPIIIAYIVFVFTLLLARFVYKLLAKYYKKNWAYWRARFNALPHPTHAG